MKELKNRWLIVVCLWGLVFPVFAEQSQKVYSIGVVPQFEVRRLHAIWNPILAQLQQRTGLRFELRGSPSIPDFERQFVHGEFDFAYMNPYHLVMANDAAGYLPLVRDLGRQLYGVLVVRKDSEITDPSQLHGKVVAFPSPNALGASLQMRQELHDKFGVKVLGNYVKTHDSVYLNVLLGEAAAGGGVQKTLNRQKQAYRDALRVIYTTTKVAPHPLTVSPKVPEAVRESVRSALLELAESADGQALLEKIPMKQIGIATLADYEPLREMGLERFAVSPN